MLRDLNLETAQAKAKAYLHFFSEFLSQGLNVCSLLISDS